MCCIVRLFWFTLLASNCFKGYCNRTYTLYCVDRVKSFLCIHLLHTPVRMNKTIPIWKRLLHSSCDLKCLFERRMKKKNIDEKQKEMKEIDFPFVSVDHKLQCILAAGIYSLLALCILTPNSMHNKCVRL